MEHGHGWSRKQAFVGGAWHSHRLSTWRRTWCCTWNSHEPVARETGCRASNSVEGAYRQASLETGAEVVTRAACAAQRRLWSDPRTWGCPHNLDHAVALAWCASGFPGGGTCCEGHPGPSGKGEGPPLAPRMRRRPSRRGLPAGVEGLALPRRTFGAGGPEAGELWPVSRLGDADHIAGRRAGARHRWPGRVAARRVLHDVQGEAACVRVVAAPLELTVQQWDRTAAPASASLHPWPRR